MDAFAFVKYAFAYPDTEEWVLRDLDFRAEEGAFVLLCGATGSGKTTLLRALKAAVAPAGQSRGSLTVLGRARDDPQAALHVGYVAQNPGSQLVMDTVWRELVFGLENLGLPPEEIRRRAAETADFFGIEPWVGQPVASLSGGQKQILNLAAVLAMQPRLLLLDEPTAQLDPIAAGQFLQLLGRVSRELGPTILLCEHRLEEVLPLADRAVYLEGGRVALDAQPRVFAAGLCQRGWRQALPAPARLAFLQGERGALPLSVREGRAWLRAHACAGEGTPAAVHTAAPAPSGHDTGAHVLTAKGLWYRYKRELPFVLRDASLFLRAGEIHAVLGGNGSGKTTLLRLLSGVYRPQRGRVRCAQAMAVLPQEPRALFTADSLWEELLELRAEGHYAEAQVREVLRALALEPLASRNPYDLSGGQMQKAALAKLLLLQPQLLLLDEPTKGLDPQAREELAELLRRLRGAGRSVLLVTHDLEFAAGLCDRCSLLFDGAIVCTEPARRFFEGNLFYTTQEVRCLRGLRDGGAP